MDRLPALVAPEIDDMYDQASHIDSGEGRVQIPENSGESEKGKSLAYFVLTQQNLLNLRC
jgi:hypothetical protein